MRLFCIFCKSQLIVRHILRNICCWRSKHIRIFGETNRTTVARGQFKFVFMGSQIADAIATISLRPASVCSIAVDLRFTLALDLILPNVDITLVCDEIYLPFGICCPICGCFAIFPKYPNHFFSHFFAQNALNIQRL